jgi:hypothetical protein
MQQLVVIFLPTFRDNLSIPSSGEEITTNLCLSTQKSAILFSDALYNQDERNIEMLYYHYLSTLPYNMPLERFKIIRQD